jgi:glycosyltransferase involved in cell wall biosynthesis
VKGVYGENNRRKLNAGELEKIRKEISGFPEKPVISVIMPVYNVKPKWLEKAVSSVMNQLYPYWELCVADDASPNEDTRGRICELSETDQRIKTVFLEKNSGISACSNAAAKLAEGEYLTFLDHDDELAPDALFEVVKAICETGAEVLYTDEELISEKDRIVSAHFKPDFSPDLLYSHNYITHLLVLKRSLFQEIGGFDRRCDGAQDYDLVLKATDQSDKIYHIPRALYRWRCIEGSTSVDPGAKGYAHEAGRRALAASLERKNIAGEVLDGYQPFFYRVRREISGKPLVSIIVPFKDQPGMLKTCFESVLQLSTYAHFEIIGVSNNSRRPETLAEIKRLASQDPRVRFEVFNEPFNYSRLNNFAVRRASGEHVVLMNNDIEIISPQWIEALLEHSQRPEVGAVGGKLIYGSNKIQHAGVIIGIAGFAGPAHRHLHRDLPGYMSRMKLTQNVSSVTASLMMVKK